MNYWLSRIRIKIWLFLGRRRCKQKRYVDALNYYEKVIRTDPAPSFAFAQAAFCLNELERYDEAIDAYERALQGAPHYADVHAYLAQIYSRLARNQESYDSIHRAFRAKPQLRDSAYWCQVLGNICLKLERWAEACAAFQKITESEKGNAEVWLGLGNSLGRMERWQEALDAYQAMAELNPNSGRAWH